MTVVIVLKSDEDAAFWIARILIVRVHVYDIVHMAPDSRLLRRAYPLGMQRIDMVDNSQILSA